MHRKLRGAACRVRKRGYKVLKHLEKYEQGVRGSDKTEASKHGSPWDSTPRKTLYFANLDISKDFTLDADYMNKVLEHDKKLASEKPKPKKRVGRPGPLGLPLVDPTQLPEGWSPREPDLDEEDIAAQIQRCRDRIEDNIMPHIFEDRLEQYLRQKESLDAMRNSEPKGLSWATLQRIKSLEEIEKLLDIWDEKRQRDNVQAILKAYRAKKLAWTGLVTYWSHGSQISKPRPFIWDEFEAINAEYQGHENFWVEGFDGPSLGINCARIEAIKMAPGMGLQSVYKYDIAFRRSNKLEAEEIPYFHELKVVYDTASSHLTISPDDLPYIAGPRSQPRSTNFPTICSTVIQGRRPYLVDLLQMDVTLLTQDARRMCQWKRTAVAVPFDSGSSPNEFIRTDGHFMRELFYYCTAPSVPGQLVISGTRDSLRPPNAPREDKRPPNNPFWPCGDPRVQFLDYGESPNDSTNILIDREERPAFNTPASLNSVNSINQNPRPNPSSSSEG